MFKCLRTSLSSKANFSRWLKCTRRKSFDLTALLAPGGTLNYGRWQDSQFPALLTAFLQASDSTREGAAYTLYNYLCQQMPIAPICFKNASVLTQWGRLSGLSPVRGNVFYQLENWTIS